MDRIDINQAQQTDSLEAALLARAQEQVEQRMEQCHRASKQILDEAKLRLHQREEHELKLAKAKSEHLYRQQVQAARIQLQREIDQLRWSIVQSTLECLPERLAALVEDEKSYLHILQTWLAHAAEIIEAHELVVELNARDHERLAHSWSEFVKASGVHKPVILSTKTHNDIGGLLVCNAERRICIDNTFKGRHTRLEQMLQELVTECLFANTKVNQKL